LVARGGASLGVLRSARKNFPTVTAAVVHDLLHIHSDAKPFECSHHGPEVVWEGGAELGLEAAGVDVADLVQHHFDGPRRVGRMVLIELMLQCYIS
jgi:hypothetical protein